MTDIVERLRERAKAAREEMTGTSLGDALHFEEAADEIEQLRRDLAHAKAVQEVWIGRARQLEALVRPADRVTPDA